MAEEGIVFFYNLAARISFSVLVDLKYCRCKYTKHHELCFCKLDSFQDRNKKELDFGGFFFSLSNSTPPNRKTGFYANHEPNKQEV
jgi:hypothetical protein